MAALEESIQIKQEVIKITPQDYPDQAGRLNNLGLGLGINIQGQVQWLPLKSPSRLGGKLLRLHQKITLTTPCI
ncbi:uncharacterized protein BDV14DRAFT_22331 [Aspergillus stella-maris]|uniref:uncharacterized protein n=1 Tax=Aspergillus stella-maris TaxID=1810926 RepID=UPI003CCDAB9E